MLVWQKRASAREGRARAGGVRARVVFRSAGGEMPRGGTRGGRDQFSWDDVKADKDRQNFLGHSIKAAVGRWQEGRDLLWYERNYASDGSKLGQTSSSQGKDEEEKRKERARAEKEEVKRREEELVSGVEWSAPIPPPPSPLRQAGITKLWSETDDRSTLSIPNQLLDSRCFR